MSGGQLLLRRAAEFRDVLRGYRVLLDGVEVGTLRRGTSVELPVAEGLHEVQVRIDWTGSALVRFEVAEGCCARFVARHRRRSVPKVWRPRDG
ncbi:MAG TPA: hypothetical protein VFY98_08325 [Intrasporangium sp.]|nr:hypothetical protein [Intrasporangium sp.]